MAEKKIAENEKIFANQSLKEQNEQAKAKNEVKLFSRTRKKLKRVFFFNFQIYKHYL